MSMILTKGLEWGLHHEFQDTEILKDTHIVTDSLRKSYDLLTGHLVAWMQEKSIIQFVDEPLMPEAALYI